jgi:LemA protein
MSSGLLIVLGVIVLIAIIAISVYNGLVSARQEVRNSWSQIDVQLKRRHDLIPNLVAAVKGAMDFEKSTARSPQESMAAENALTSALGRFIAVAEAYPQLRSQEGVSSLMEELKNTENKIAFARQHYNDSVQAQNIRVSGFPGVLFARTFGFTPETMFEVPAAEHAAIETAPEVKF